MRWWKLAWEPSPTGQVLGLAPEDLEAAGSPLVPGAATGCVGWGVSCPVNLVMVLWR